MWASERAYDREIIAAATGAGIPTALLRAIVGVESGYNPRAYRAEPQIHDASRGLCQVLERTARALGYTGVIGDAALQPGAALVGLYDPATSCRLGARLLAENLKRARRQPQYPDPAVDIAIAAYNAGFSTQRIGDAKRDASGNIANAAYVTKVKTALAYFVALEAAAPAPAPPPTPAPNAPPSAGGAGGVPLGCVGLVLLLAAPAWALLSLVR